MEDDDVSVDFGWTKFEARNRPDGVGEDAGIGVIFGEAVDVVIQGVERAGGDDAGLAHAAAEEFASRLALLD